MHADWSQARLHAQCSLPSITPESTALTCTCCFRSKGQPISLCSHAKQLEPLGSGFPLYFSFLKYTLILLLLLILSYSCLSLSWTIQYNQSFCLSGETKIVGNQQIKCTSWMVLLARLEQDVNLSQNMLRATSFAIQLLFLLYMRDNLLRMQAYYQQRRGSLSSDYAVMVARIPGQKGVGAKLRHLLEGIADVQKVVLVPQLGKYVELKEEAIHLEGKIRELARTQGLQTEKASFLTARLRKLYAEIDEQHQKEKEAINNDESECQRAIIILSTNPQRNALLDNPPPLQKIKSIFFTQSLSFSAAPEPSQILWNNIDTNRATKTRGLLTGWGLFVLLLGCVTCGFYFLMEFKSLQIEHALAVYKKFPEDARDTKLLATAVVLLTLLGVVLFNKLLLAGLLQGITRLEKHSTTGSFQLSFSIKYALGLFFTTAIMTLLVENIRFHNIYQHDFGVVQQETIMFAMNTFFVPLLWLTNPWYIAKRIKQFLHKDSSTYSQTEANQLMEFPEYSLGKRYAEVVEWVWFTFLYASVIPVGACVMLIGLAAFYWVDKLNLLKKSSIKQQVGGNLSVKAMAMLDLTLVLRPAGELIFDQQMRGEWNYQSAICLIVGVIYLLLPLNQMLAILHGQEFHSKQKTYKEISEQLADSYERHHPLYMPHQRLPLSVPSNKFQYDVIPNSEAPSIQATASIKLIQSQFFPQQNPELK